MNTPQDPEAAETVQTTSVPAVVQPRLVRQGMLFQDAQKMRVVRPHEKIPETWWCEGVTEGVGLWAHSAQFIAEHSLPNTPAQPPQVG